MLTYNQEDFIAQAIEGVLMQKTNFPIQLVIGEDCSTDRTREICEKYAIAHPDKIKLILNEKNIGLGANYVNTYEQCTGKYVAICDGDDYWTDPLKLEKQVNFLESHPDYDIIFTGNENLFPSGNMKKRNINKVPKNSSFEELVFGNYIASVTVLFRKKDFCTSLTELIKTLPYGDWPTYLWITKEGGKIHLLKEVTAVYRKDFGTSTALRRVKSRLGEINLTILEGIQKLPHFEYQLPIVEKAINRFKAGLIASYFKERKYLKSFRLWYVLTKEVGNIIPTRILLYLIRLKLKF